MLKGTVSTMSSVFLHGYIQVPPDDLEAVKAELPNHVELTRAEAGCLVFEVVQDDEDPCRFAVHEEFTDRASFESHQARVKRSRWGAITARVARHYEITESDGA